MKNNIEATKEETNSFTAAMPRTNFFVSFCYLIVQVLIPGALLFFLTSRDFSFAFKLPIWTMVLLALALLVFALATTFLTYKFNLHQLDQFTYIIPFASFIIGLYLTSYWLNQNYFLIRFIIAFGCAVVGMFLAGMIVLIIRKRIKGR